jgi:lysophospholipase L1-like esterase
MVALLAAGCGPPAPNLDSPGTTIVCLGDSITAGVGTGGEPAYPQLLAERLGREVVAEGVPGDTAAEGLARLSQVLAHDPWLVIVELGGNDILQQRPVEETRQALTAIVEKLLAARVVPLLVEVSGPFGGERREVFDQLADEYRVPVVRGVLTDILRDRRLRADAVHPNGAGHRRLAEALAKAVEPLLAARRRAS